MIKSLPVVDRMSPVRMGDVDYSLRFEHTNRLGHVVPAGGLPLFRCGERVAHMLQHSRREYNLERPASERQPAPRRAEQAAGQAKGWPLGAPNARVDAIGVHSPLD